jgi:hypothetical protein
MKLWSRSTIAGVAFAFASGIPVLAQSQSDFVTVETRPERSSNGDTPPNRVKVEGSAVNARDPISPVKNKWHLDKKFWALWLPAIGMQLTDAAMTQYCVAQPDCRERNPLLGRRPSPLLIYGFKAGVVGVSYWFSRAGRQHRDKSWIAYPIMLSAFGAAAVVSNSITLSRLGTPQPSAVTTPASVSPRCCAVAASFTRGIQFSSIPPANFESIPVKLRYKLIAPRGN